jgi:hypothetical protein
MKLSYSEWSALKAFDDKLDLILSKLDVVLNQGATNMASAQDLVALVTQEKDLDTSIITMLKGLQATVATMPATQAAIDKVAGMIGDNIVALTGAVGAGTGTTTTVTPADVAAVPAPASVDVTPTP